MTGDAWKKMRTLSSPVFTSGKLKLMVPHVNKVTITDPRQEQFHNSYLSVL